MLRITLLPVTFALVGAPLLAQEDAVLEGHSHHGAAFNEGPRQAAYLMDGQGTVHFDATIRDERARAFFEQGVSQLHGFWYFEAERSFRQCAAIEPDCAMAYWGMALANVEKENEERAKGFAAEAWKRREATTKREQLYIAAVKRYYWGEEDPKTESKADEASKTDGASKDGEKKPTTNKPKAIDDKARRRRLVEDFEEIVYEFPDDIEAKGLLANQLWLNNRYAGMPISSRGANQSLLDQLFEKAPMHPAHHYRIHLWDQKKNAHRVVDSAAKIGHSAPGIAHMWHMSGHIWARLDRHADAAWQQEASARVDHAHMMRDRVLPDQIHNFAHNNEWLVRSLRHVGRVHDAIDLAKNMVELPRHPKWNTLDQRGSAQYGRRRLLEVLEMFEFHEELIALSDTMYLERSGDPDDDAKLAFALGKAKLACGDLDGADAAIANLESALAAARLKRAEAVDEAEDEALEAKKKPAEIEGAIDEAMNEHKRGVRGIREMLLTLRALTRFERGEHDDALKVLDGKLPKGPLARLYARIDKFDKAIEHAKKDAEKEGMAWPLANLADIQWRAGKQDDAKQTFAKLRELSARFDLDVKPFARLAEIAKAAGHPADWRVEEVTAKDVGERPPLDSLGPFRWSPGTALSWSCPDGFGNTRTLADYRGRPVLVIFFLGFGCVHCVEQLQAFRPVANEFAKAGIDIVAIGTDEVSQLSRSQSDRDEADAYPFPILADPKHEVFKRYRCFDDFEDLPLHGTFLIDGNGLVRWQDIGFEPFMDHEFVRKEAQRLLGIPARG